MLKTLQLHRVWRDAHAAGAMATHVADVAIFGTRRTPRRNAGMAGPRRTVDGSIGRHSVWEGPTRIPGGAPVLRRDKPA